MAVLVTALDVGHHSHVLFCDDSAIGSAVRRLPWRGAAGPSTSTTGLLDTIYLDSTYASKPLYLRRQELCEAYARKGEWGGAIEIAVLSR